MYKQMVLAMALMLLAAPLIAQAIAIPPGISDIGSRVSSVLNSAMKSSVFKIPAADITHVGMITYPGDTFQNTFNLVNTGAATLPDTNSADGVVTRLYKTYRMTDQAGNMVQEGYVEITTPVAPSSTVAYDISLPVATSTPSGKYSSVAVLFKIDQTWTRSTNTWATGNAVVLDKQGVTFDVQTPTPPPVPPQSDVLAQIAALFNQIISWILGLFS